MRIEAILAAAFGLCLIAAGPARADGGGNDNSDTTTCGKGQVWDSNSKKCVKAENGVLPDKALTDYAYALVKAGRYRVVRHFDCNRSSDSQHAGSDRFTPVDQRNYVFHRP
jgi:hypothetical protein